VRNGGRGDNKTLKVPFWLFIQKSPPETRKQFRLHNAHEIYDSKL